MKKALPGRLANVFRKAGKTNLASDKMSTSISDNQTYPDFCIRASMATEVFSDFRRNEVYREILEHVSNEQGQGYLDEIIRNKPDLLDSIELFKQNDAWGDPETFQYSQTGKISPSTLRYIKELGDLMSLFEGLDGSSICEIGVGYGGQCRIINCITRPAEYTLVDIKPALMLAQRYLDNYILNSVLKYRTMNELETTNYDLVISNYAFSELPRSIQDAYLKKIILNSRRGYITFNEISPEHFKSYKSEELLQIIPDSRIIEEKPLTHEKNCIIVWGDKT